MFLEQIFYLRDWKGIILDYISSILYLYAGFYPKSTPELSLFYPCHTWCYLKTNTQKLITENHLIKAVVKYKVVFIKQPYSLCVECDGIDETYCHNLCPINAQICQGAEPLPDREKVKLFILVNHKSFCSQFTAVVSYFVNTLLLIFRELLKHKNVRIRTFILQNLWSLSLKNMIHYALSFSLYLGSNIGNLQE